MSIEIAWLSLKNSFSGVLKPFGRVDVYVGLDSAPQTLGRMRAHIHSRRRLLRHDRFGACGSYQRQPIRSRGPGLAGYLRSGVHPRRHVGHEHAASAVERLTERLTQRARDGPGGVCTILPEPSPLPVGGVALMLMDNDGLYRKFLSPECKPREFRNPGKPAYLCDGQ